MKELELYIDGKLQLPKSVVITIDDGWRSKLGIELLNEYKLNGYTLNNPDIVSKIDKNYDEKSFIYGMKLKKDGSFMGYSKVLSESEIDEFIEIVSNNIDKMIEALNNCEFDINPKKIKNKNIGCEYCSFKDICYVNNSNIVELESEDENDDTE